jgi:hypothetical protein
MDLDIASLKNDQSIYETPKIQSEIEWTDEATALGELLSTNRYALLSRWLMERGYSLRQRCWTSKSSVRAIWIDRHVFREVGGRIVETGH